MGDRNTKLFHNKVQKSKWRNRIHSIMNSGGNQFLESWKAIMYANTPANLGSLHQLFTHVITEEEENIMSTAVPNEEEVLSIVKSLNPWKAPGLGGFNDQFYKSCWNIIGKDVLSIVQQFFKGELNLGQINQTLLIPIPKCNSTQMVSDFRPISLCNEIAKSSPKS